MTSRFGDLHIGEENIIHFPEGLIGIPDTQWTVVRHREDSPFLWLQSLNTPELALPVCSPWDFCPGYALDIADDDAERLDLGDGTDIVAYTVVRADENGACTNLKAPILLRGRIGHQVLNVSPEAQLRAPIASR